MSRTNIDLDDDLVTLVMEQHNFKTKREAVNYALRRVAIRKPSLDEVLALEGSGWGGDLEEMRRSER